MSKLQSSLFTLALIFAGGFPAGLAYAQAVGKETSELVFPLKFGNAAADDAGEAEIAALLKPIDSQSVELQVTVTLPEGHYTYSMDKGFAGATKIVLKDTGSLSISEGDWKADHKPKVVLDEVLGQTVEKYFSKVTWSRVLKGSVTGDTKITGEVVGQYCGSGTCRPFEKSVFTAMLQRDDSPSVAAPAGSAEPDRNPVSVSPKIGFGKAAKEGLIQFDIRLSPSHPAVGQEVMLSIRATVKEPWHTFALDQDPEMAGTPTEIELKTLKGLQVVDRSFKPSVEPHIERPLDGIVQRVHFNEVTWSRRLTLTEPSAVLGGTIAFQMCRNGSCLPPSSAEFELTLTAGTSDTGPRDAEAPTVVKGESQTTDDEGASDRQGFFAFLLTAVVAGFVALLTPCVFPMIPVTVAFFLKQEEKKPGSSIRLAIIYSLSIMAAFTILGLIAAAFFGPASLNTLANNEWLNLFFAGLFLLFGLMLLGVWEIQIPSWLLTWTSKREATGGVVGVVFMAITFTLVSFTCTFAFVGSLLAWAAKGQIFWPVVGMLAFSAAFASPFFLLALFPSQLKRLPRSGGWMNDVKVTMGIVELALVAKFLSVADIGFSVGYVPVFITYNVFMISWIVLSAVAGIYLLGLFRKQMGPVSSTVKTVRNAFAMLFMLLAGYITAGLFVHDMPLKPLWYNIASFAPPDVKVRKTEGLGYVISQHKMDYALEFEKAVASAEIEDRPLFVDFTGVNCVNCRKMERSVLIDAAVVQKLETLVRVQLYTDLVPGIRDKQLNNRLKAMNKGLQESLVDSVSLPHYAVVSSDGKTVLSIFDGLDSSGGEDFLQFLNAGLSRWEELKKINIAAGNSSVGH
jgi:thiol:disulfide interchange protein DsbD